MKNLQLLNGMLSIGALVCLLAGWFQLLPPDVNSLLVNRVFYFLIGMSFIFQGALLPGRTFTIIMYISAAFCIIGAFLPLDMQISKIKVVGLLAGVISSFFGRRQASN